MKICLITNPNSGSSELVERLHRLLEERDDITCWQTAEPGEGARYAKRALEEDFHVIAAAGGDGTVHEVVNGIMEHGGDVRLGIIPLGTGNDLARTLAIPPDPRDALALLEVGQTARLDLLRVESDGRMRFAVNAAAGGFSGQVDEVLTEEMKTTWGPLAYLLSAASVVPDLQNYETYIAYDDGPEEQVHALNVIVANGRTVGGGKRVAPLANPVDGLLDVVVVKWGTMLNFAEVGARLLTGNYLDSPHVLYRKVRKVRVISHPGMWFNVDGELLTKEPVTFSVAPAALEVVVGTDFQPEPPRKEDRG